MRKPKYKHMSPYECYLFDYFLRKHNNEFDTFDFDVRVGDGMKPPEHLSQPYRDLSVLLTQKRIDAIGYHNTRITIFEVKPNAALSALGQLIGYRDLYIRQFNPTIPPKLAVVTDFVGRDEEFYFQKRGIHIYDYPKASANWRIFHGI